MRRLAPLLLLPLLAACTDASWDRLMSFGKTAPPAATQPAARQAAAAPAPQSAPAAPDPFCLGVARHDAAGKGFDQATEGKVTIRSYQQCVTLFAGKPAD